MSAISLMTPHIDRRLAQTVAVTGRWKRSSIHRLTRRAAAAIDFTARGVFYLWRNRRYLTPAKVVNMALVHVQFKLKTERVIGRPVKMKIEPTNICNTKCQLCPTGIGLTDRPKGKMDFGKFTALIDKLRWHLFAVDLSMWGDPLIVPDIFRMIRHCHDRGIWTYISSNLHAFKIQPKRGETKDQATMLVESGLDMLTCSLHGASQETYAHYQPGKDFGEAIEKVRHIIKTRDAMGSSTPVVQLNFVVTRHNEHEKDAFVALAEDLGCRPVLSTAAMNLRFQDRDQKLQPLGLAPDLLNDKRKALLDNWLPEDEGYVLEPYKKIRETGEMTGEQYNGYKPFDCSWPWKQSVVNWDGEVVTCCGSFETEHDMGNVLEQPLSAIWNSEKYRMARRSFKHKLTDEQAKDNACAICPGFML